MKASSTEIGIVKIGTSADGMCQRNSRITSATMIHLDRQLVLERVDGARDPVGAIVRGDDSPSPSAARAQVPGSFLDELMT